MSLKAALETAAQIQLIYQAAVQLDGMSHFPERLRLEVAPQDILNLAVFMSRLNETYQEILSNVREVAV